MDILNSGLLRSGLLRKHELVGELNKLHASLPSINQEVSARPPALNNIAAQLVDKNRLFNNDMEVRLLSCCCIVDILRIYAPEPPYDDGQLLKIFEAIISLLDSFGNYKSDSAVWMKIFYILKSLSVVRSGAVLVLMANQGTPVAVELVLSFLKCLFSIIRPEQHPDIISHAEVILQTCIEETEIFEQSFIDIILLPLLPSAQIENAAAYSVAQTLLMNTYNILKTPICNFVNEVLVGNAHRESDLLEHMYPLIFELHNVSPQFLMHIIPNLCTQLTAEDAEIRLKSTKLLGCLLASPHADYGVEFPRNFREFLSRFQDASSEVRLEMVESCSLIFRQKLDLRALVEGPLVGRLRDPEWEVRLATLRRLGDICVKDVCALLPESLDVIIGRVTDKKASVRRLVITVLARSYNRHVSSQLGRASEGCGLRVGDVDPDVWARLGKVPAILVKYWGYPEHEDKQLMMKLLQEQIIPKTFRVIGETRTALQTSPQMQTPVEVESLAGAADDGEPEAEAEAEGLVEEEAVTEDRRAAALLLMFCSLSQETRVRFGTLLGDKAKIRRAFAGYLAFHFSNVGVQNQTRPGKSAVAADLPAALLSEYEGHLKNIVAAAPPIEKKSHNLDRLLTCKDKNVFRLLQRATSQHCSYGSYLATRDDVCRRLDSKSPTGTYIAILLDLVCFGTGGRDVGAALLSAVGLKDNESDLYQLLSLLSKHSPQVFDGCGMLMARWFWSSFPTNPLSRSEVSASRSKKKPNQIDKEDLRSITVNKVSLTMCLKSIEQAASLLANEDEVSISLVKALLEGAQQCPKSELSTAVVEAACLLFTQSTDQYTTESICSSMKTVVTMLLASTRLSLSSSRLACDLGCLSAMLKSTAFLTPGQREKCIAFVKKVLRSDTTSPDSLCAAFNVWTSSLCCDVDESSIVTTHLDADASSVDMEVNLHQLMDDLFIVVRSQGRTVGVRSVEDAQSCCQLRCVAACCLFDLVKLKAVGKRLSVAEWQSLGWTLLDSDQACKTSILNKLSILIQTHTVHPRILAYMCLVAPEETLANKASAALSFVVRRLRKTSADLRMRAMLPHIPAEEADRLLQLASMNLPECIVPYVFYLVSHHPDFPSADECRRSDDNAEDRQRMRTVVCIVNMVIDVLLNSTVSVSGADEGSNLSYLIKQTDLIAQFYADRLDNGNVGLKFVTKLARKVLGEKAKSSHQAQPCPAEIPLPMDIYQAIEEVDITSPIRNRRLSDIEMEDRVLNRAIAKNRSSPKFHRQPRTSTAVDHKRKLQPKVQRGVRGDALFGSNGHDRDEDLSDGQGDKEGEDEDADEEERLVSSSHGHTKKRKKANESRTTGVKRKSDKKPSAITKKVKPTVEPMRTRALPSRGARAAAVSYVEVEENDDEVEEWENAATAIGKQQRKSKSLVRERDLAGMSPVSPDESIYDQPDVDVFHFETVADTRKASSKRLDVTNVAATKSFKSKETLVLNPAQSGVSTSGSQSVSQSISTSQSHSYSQALSETYSLPKSQGPGVGTVIGTGRLALKRSSTVGKKGGESASQQLTRRSSQGSIGGASYSSGKASRSSSTSIAASSSSSSSTTTGGEGRSRSMAMGISKDRKHVSSSSSASDWMDDDKITAFTDMKENERNIAISETKRVDSKKRSF